MRHVGMAVFGLFGVIVGLVALGTGIYLAFQAMSTMDTGGMLLALLALLVGGAVVGGVLVAGRFSRAAPLTGGLLLLAIAVSGAFFPNNVFSISGVGMGAVTGGPLAVVVLLGAVVVRPTRSPAPVATYPPGPGPLRPGPYAPGPYAPGAGPPSPGTGPQLPGPYAPDPGQPPPGPYAPGPGPYPPGLYGPGPYPPGAYPDPRYAPGSSGGPHPGFAPPASD